MAGGCPKFRSALKCYGKASFEWEILFQGWDRNYVLEVVEPLMIKEYNTFSDDGYNLTEGGEGCIFSEQHKLNMSLAQKGRPSPYKGKIGRYTKDSLSKMSEAKLGKPGPNRGRVLSEETKMKMSIAAKNRIKK